MTTNVGIGSGTTVYLDNASGTPVLLDEVLEVTPPNPKVDDVEATHMASTAREYIAGLIDYGEGNFKFNYIPNNATDILIRAAIVDKVGRTLTVTIPLADGTHQQVSCECIVKGWERDVPIDDRLTAVMSVRFSGSPSESHA